MRRPELASGLVSLVLAASPLTQQPAPAGDGSLSGAVELGGPATIRDASNNAFSFPSPVLSTHERRDFLVGNSFFKQNWVTTPASTPSRDGLGPLFNARSCSSCHLRDGRSAPPAAGDRDRHGLLLRIGVRNGDGPDLPHAMYGGQIQHDAIAGVPKEADVVIDYEVSTGQYGDGSPFELLRPRFSLSSLGYGPLGEGVVLGARTAPHVIGLGLLEALPEAQLAAWADPDDRDGNGISGRIHYGGDGQVGRFGWKATQPTVRAQTAAAFANDIGITSSLFPVEDLGDLQRSLLHGHDGNLEIDEATLQRVVYYTQALAVPAQRSPQDAWVVRGRVVFSAMGCAACHVPVATTGDDAFHQGYRRIEFAAFTDLLLHDMGEGLADEKHDGDAHPSEWRTPPLWGIGLFPVVGGHTRYLHDGRARDLAEAILWHGGEAAAAREDFRLAPAIERAALLAFLGSL